MTPIKKDRKPAPYKEKGSKKTRAVKFVVTEDEMKALEALSKDWNISIAQAVRTMISIAGETSNFLPIFQQPEAHKLLKQINISPEILPLLEWRMITLKRFLKYWNKEEPDVNKL